MQKYLVIAGYIISRSDAQRHHISARTLCDLYGISPHAPNVILIENEEDMKGMSISDPKQGQWIILRPRYDGNYGLINGKPK